MLIARILGNLCLLLSCKSQKYRFFPKNFERIKNPNMFKMEPIHQTDLKLTQVFELFKNGEIIKIFVKTISSFVKK